MDVHRGVVTLISYWSVLAHWIYAFWGLSVDDVSCEVESEHRRVDRLIVA
jgi:hypothetical protein